MTKELINILVNSILERELKRVCSAYIHGRLIDIGCGNKPYATLLSPFVSEHVGVDHHQTLHDKSSVDLFGTAYEIPCDDGSFDTAICTAVLEHLEEPEKALRECFRVLKPGGVAVYSVPFIWHLHEEPRDFYRFSKYGLRHLFIKTGFDLLELKALSGFWTTFGQLLVYYMHRFHRGPAKLIPFIPAAGLAIQGASYVLDRIDKAERWTWMYLVVAKKP
jgi:SAM-dependent methyltransferase